MLRLHSISVPFCSPSLSSSSSFFPLHLYLYLYQTCFHIFISSDHQPWGVGDASGKEPRRHGGRHAPTLQSWAAAVAERLHETLPTGAWTWGWHPLPFSNTNSSLSLFLSFFLDLSLDWSKGSSFQMYIFLSIVSSNDFPMVIFSVFLFLL